LADLVAARGSLCAGIDPHPSLLHRWGLPDDAAGLTRFALACVDAFAGEVAVVKPQSAFFERHGSAGVAVLERVIAAARAAGALVLLDAKRGDIGSTMAAYADAYLTEGSPVAADAVTVSPYLGFGSLRPAIDAALASGRGVFVLAMTSNPEGSGVQRATTTAGRTVAQSIVDAAAEHNAGAKPIGSIGVVIGATVRHPGLDLSALNGPILAPGFGAQGATASDLRAVFGPGPRFVLPSSSRALLEQGPSIGAMRTAVRRVQDELAAA